MTSTAEEMIPMDESKDESFLKTFKRSNAYRYSKRGIAGAGEVYVIFLLFSFGIEYGGPTIMVFGWILMVIMTFIVILNMAEMCNAFPNCSASVYSWVGNLVSKPWSPFVSYITAVWLMTAYIANTAKIAFAIAQLINYALVLSDFDLLNNSFLVLIAILITTFWLIVVPMQSDFKYISYITFVSSYAQSFVTIAVILTVFILCKDLNSSTFVLTDFRNHTGWEDWYCILVGIVFFPLVSCHDGYIGFCQVYNKRNKEIDIESIEESKDFTLVILFGFVWNGSLGLILILALLYTVQSVDQVITFDSSGAFDIISQNSNKHVSAFIAWLLIIILTFYGITFTEVGVRLTHALFKEKAFPFHENFSMIDVNLEYPLNAQTLFAVLVYALLCVPLMSSYGSTAFYMILSTSVLSYQITFTIPIIIKLFFLNYSAKKALKKSAFYLGDFSYFLGIVALIWQVTTITLLLFPFNYPVTTLNMNYSFVVVFIVLTFGGLNWIFFANENFIGPQRSVSSPDISRETSRNSSCVFSDSGSIDETDPERASSEIVVEKASETEIIDENTLLLKK